LALKQWQRQDYYHNLFAGNRYHFGFRDLRTLAYVCPMDLFPNAPALVVILGAGFRQARDKFAHRKALVGLPK
jgi:hypothetical protein